MNTHNQQEKGTLGNHILVEFYGCDPEILNDVSKIEQSMLDAARVADATIINSTFHHFSPFGVSGVVVIQESHLAVHTWPEYRYAAVDVFTCGDSVDPWKSYKHIEKAFGAEYGSAMELKRGQQRLLPYVDFKGAYESGQPDSIQPKFERNVWFTERNDNIALSLRHTGEILFRDKSPFQKVEVIDTFAYGRMLTLDGAIMTTEKDEYVYHEMITHVSMFTHPNPKKVLVIGAGDGGAVKELVKHENIEKIVMVEIDGMVIEASRKFLPTISNQLDNPKVELIIGDGIKYVMEAADESFDIIIIDSTDPVGPAEGIFSEEFYRNAYRVLAPNGIFTNQSESPRFNVKVFKEIFKLFREIYGEKNVHTYLAGIATYPSGTWSFSYCAKGGIHPINDFRADEAKEFAEKHDLNYYDENVHKAAFALPRYVKKLLNK